MNHAEFNRNISRLAKAIGQECYITVSISAFGQYPNSHPDTPLQAAVYPFGSSHYSDRLETKHHADLDSLWDDIVAVWEAASAAFKVKLIRRLALDVIKITADQGACTPAALRSAGYSQEDIDKHGEAACLEANNLSANRPFTIAPDVAKSNMPPPGEFDAEIGNTAPGLPTQH